MACAETFTWTNPALVAVLEELRLREPIFHVAQFGSTIADFERLMSPDYWEVGASGRRYSREFILGHLRENPPVDAATAGWTTEQHALRQLGPETYWLTYTLRQQKRVTRRATICNGRELDGKFSTTRARSQAGKRMILFQCRKRGLFTHHAKIWLRAKS